MVVVASRSTLSEAQDYRARHASYDISEIYLSENGWYALVTDQIDSDKATAILNFRKSQKLIPDDSYCSSGRLFVQRVWSQDDAIPSTSYAASSELLADFDARPLTADEKRFLQASLALTGDYDGRIDGQWGRGSQLALESWAFREFGESPNNFLTAFLAASGSEMLENGDWDFYYDRDLDVSLLVPFALVHAGEANGQALDIEADDDSFTALVTRMDRSSAIGFHKQLIDTASGQYRVAPYIVRKDAFWVTSYSDGANMIYQWTDFVRNTRFARTALFIANDFAGHAMANLLVASYRTGSQRTLELPPDGQLMTYMQAALDALSAEDEDAAPAISPPAAQSASQARFSGSGFYINDNADIMTNAHVIEGCRQLTVDGADAEIAAIDKRLDLAILNVGTGMPQTAAVLAFSSTPARLNSDVTVAGFPLKGLLDTLNVTRGSVSALIGMDNDATRLQITAPVQAGNSGGPIVNQHGQVVGVVVSKMNGLTVADMTGDLPQNINFGVRGSIARIFAEANSITTSQSDEAVELSPESLAEQLSKATVLIECY